MTIEQRPELNRFVDPTIPITWAWRWRLMKIVLPIWCFIWACYLEMGIVAAWLRDKLNLEFAFVLISALLLFTAVMWALIEIPVRSRHRSKRVLKMDDKGIVVRPAKNGAVLWEKVCRFQFEPVSEFPGGCRLLIFLRGFKKEKQVERPFLAMVLEPPSQTKELEGWLKIKRDETKSDFDIVTLSEPSATPPAKPFPSLGLCLYMGGLYFLIHGGPILLALLNRNHHDSDSRFTPEESAKLGHFLLKHFSNIEEFRHFFLTLSICLIIAGITLMACGWRLKNPKPASVTSLN